MRGRSETAPGGKEMQRRAPFLADAARRARVGGAGAARKRWASNTQARPPPRFAAATGRDPEHVTLGAAGAAAGVAAAAPVVVAAGGEELWAAAAAAA